ncbi:MAG: alpha-isopropylmalate synthase regulatory domain-containing protein [Verrucomicrobiota bacterium]
MPYLTIDPQDIGRSYEAIIRINSQSGKGGVAYVLDREHGFDLPKTMHPQVGGPISAHADEIGRELSAEEIGDFFFEHFVNAESPLRIDSFELDHTRMQQGEVSCDATVSVAGERFSGQGTGNGPINAFVHFLDQIGKKEFRVTDYRSQALRGGSDADSAAYVQIDGGEGIGLVWGCGVDPSIEMAGLKALVTAWNLTQKGTEA